MISISRILLALAALACAGPALAVSHFSATAPYSAKAVAPESFRMAPGALPSRAVRLGTLDEAQVLSVKIANSASWNKRLQIGIGRDVPASPEARSDALVWVPVPGGMAAQWEVASAGARALRVGLTASRLPAGTEVRFVGEGAAGTVYGPFGEEEFAAMGATYWSPVLEGESAIVEIFVPDGSSPSGFVIALSQVSHLFASPSQPDVELLAKAAGTCEVDVVCRSATDAALASVAKSVARMTFVVGGNTSTCTGTLLNPRDGSFTPYFYSANHCISTQASASTLTTHWFYDRTGCGTGSTSASYVQLAGGGTLVYANEPSDALLLRLNGNPPSGAVFSGWDQATLATGTPLTGVHHPAGDLKKVSLAVAGGFGTPGNPSGSFIRANWNSTATGVTEPGSSGSGIFTAVGQPATDYRFRGGLWGGPSSCTASAGSLYDYYSRFDQVYPAIAQYLDATPVYGALYVTFAGTGSGTVTSSPSNINCRSGLYCSASFESGTTVTLTAVASIGSDFTGWSGGACTGIGTCVVTLSASAEVTANFTTIDGTAPVLLVTPTGLDFGGQSMRTTAPSRAVTLTNVGTGTIALTGLSLDVLQFGHSSNCTTIASGSSCTVTITFTPTQQGTVYASLEIATSAGARLVGLAGTGEKSLVTHYYRSTLGRAPDPGGKVYWDAQAARVQALGANSNEIWYAMAASFYFSAEYLALNRDNAGFVTDLYGTFFNRAPDAAGFADWTGQLAAGMPREVVLASFMFSPEFASFTQAIFGTTVVRKEIDVVGDFYRGLLARLPDDGGFDFWVRQFRVAQCSGIGGGDGASGVDFLAVRAGQRVCREGADEFAVRGRSLQRVPATRRGSRGREFLDRPDRHRGENARECAAGIRGQSRVQQPRRHRYRAGVPAVTPADTKGHDRKMKSAKFDVSAVIATLLLVALAGGAAAVEKMAPLNRAVLMFDPGFSDLRVPPPPELALVQKGMLEPKASLSINYLLPGAGQFGDTCIAWPEQAKSAFTFAANVWASLLESSVPITIDACWANNLGANVLGHAGASGLFRNFPGAPVGNTYYPVALANALSRSDLDTARSDIYAAFGSTFTWHFGVDGNVPTSQVDFASVVLHEIGHGLGFSGSMQVASGLGSWGLGSTVAPVAYDRFTENGAGQALINTAIFPNPSAALATQLQSGAVFFDGTNANIGNGGARVPLHAPATFSSGSSFSHLAESFNGTPNALMTFSLANGESLHSPGPVALGMFKDMGWTVLASSSSTLTVTRAGSGSGTVTSSPAGINCGTSCAATFTPGASVALTATPVSGSVFGGWGGSCAGTGSCTVMMSAARAVTATFTECAYTLTPASQSVASAPSTGFFNVTTTSVCSWAAISNASWISTSASGTGSATVTYSVAANSGATPRTGTVTVGGQVFTVTQAATAFYALTITKAGTGSGTVVSSPAGINCGTTCIANVGNGATITLTASAASGSVFSGWSGGGCSGLGTCTTTMSAVTAITATFLAQGTAPTPLASPASRDFSGQSMRTTAPSQTVAVMNAGAGTLTVTSVTLSNAQFAQSNNCTTLLAGASCTVTLTFTPTAQGTVSGTLTIVTSGGTQTVALAGTGEKSLVTHYYRSILGRAPDTGGKAFWDGEATRVQSLGADVNEVWYAMAGSFYSSSEYAAYNRDNAGFVTDLYGTFFNRAPDTAGFDDWMSQLAAGMPREVVLASFMFSSEFSAFTQAIFGGATVRKEIDVVGDFYRGLLARLPDDGGFNFWLQKFRAAQCQGAASVTAQAESISSQFALGGEYVARARTNSQYVGDLYNAFLRRGGDLAGVRFWINQIATGARSRENVRQAFVGSAEFSGRVASIIAQGCLP